MLTSLKSTDHWTAFYLLKLIKIINQTIFTRSLTKNKMLSQSSFKLAGVGNKIYRSDVTVRRQIHRRLTVTTGHETMLHGLGSWLTAVQIFWPRRTAFSYTEALGFARKFIFECLCILIFFYKVKSRAAINRLQTRLLGMFSLVICWGTSSEVKATKLKTPLGIENSDHSFGL